MPLFVPVERCDADDQRNETDHWHADEEEGGQACTIVVNEGPELPLKLSDFVNDIGAEVYGVS